MNHTWPSFQSHIFRLKEISLNQLVSFIIGQPLLTQKYLLISTAGAVDNHLREKQNTQKLGISNHCRSMQDENYMACVAVSHILLAMRESCEGSGTSGNSVAWVTHYNSFSVLRSVIDPCMLRTL